MQKRKHLRFGAASATIAPWLLMTCCAGLAACDVFSDDMTTEPRSFSADAWRANRGNARCDMVEHLVDHIGLTGRSRSDLYKMLGAPDSASGGADFYHLCPSFMDIYVLEIRWRDDKVRVARVRDT